MKNLFFLADGAGHRRVGRRLHWRNLDEREPREFAVGLAARLPTPAIWISIDKDVLRPEDAATNWDQGGMPLSFLIEVLTILAEHRRIVGVDLCGDYAPPAHTHWLKRIESWRDQPRAAPADLATNERANRALLHLFDTVLA